MLPSGPNPCHSLLTNHDLFWRSESIFAVKGQFNVAWRRPQRKRTLPTMADGDDLPPLSATGDEQGQDSSPSGNAAGDGLGDSTAPAPRGKAKTGSKQKETADA